MGYNQLHNDRGRRKGKSEGHLYPV